MPSTRIARNVPLRVMLHGAGLSGDNALKAGLADKGKLHFYGDENFTLLYIDCRDNSQNDWWWGYHKIKAAGDTYKNELTPTEKRVLSTIEWVVQNYNIDRNRIYLSGVSMGGSGSLGIGMCRGDIFAAINVMVPAGVDHFLHRMKNTSHPEPAPVINFSSHIDGWARGQEDFLDYMNKNRYPVVLAFGTFGHTNVAAKTKSVVLEYPWLDIVKNQAYPVFTNATTNQEYPGFMNKKAPNQEGQLNAYFRWKNIRDVAEKFEMQLRLVRKNELEKKYDVPAKSIADITLRRLQKFNVDKAQKYKWSISQQSGVVSPDKKGLITIKQVEITGKPAVLAIEPVK